MGKGVFTISNMGMLGVEEFAAIINPPESGILAIAGVREAVIVKDGAMRAGRVMTLTLSVDHRVVDGAAGGVVHGAVEGIAGSAGEISWGSMLVSTGKSYGVQDAESTETTDGEIRY